MRLGLTTLAERRNRGDLIETYKILSKSVSYGEGLFNVGRGGLNLLNKRGSHGPNKCTRSFVTERVVKYWNKLPKDCKLSSSINAFKSNLEIYKKSNFHIAESENYWDISDLILSKIEGPSYLKNKAVYNQYLLDNPVIARRRGVNLFVPNSL